MLAWAVHVDVPVLVLNGARDGPNRHDEPAFLRALPSARPEALPTASHVRGLERPEASRHAVAGSRGARRAQPSDRAYRDAGAQHKKHRS